MADIKIELTHTDYRKVVDGALSDQSVYDASANTGIDLINSGTAFELKIVSVKILKGMGLGDESLVDVNSGEPSIHVGSTDALSFSIKFTVNIADVTDNVKIPYLTAMTRTKGVIKLTTTDDASNKIILRFIPMSYNLPTNVDTTGTTTFFVRMSNLSFSQSVGDGDFIDGNMTLIVEGG